MRRFTRLTDGLSKKVENLTHAVSLHYMHYNFGRPHQTLSKATGRPTTPAMAAGIADRVWSLTLPTSLGFSIERAARIPHPAERTRAHVAQ